jgi:hypothetical protein
VSASLQLTVVDFSEDRATDLPLLVLGPSVGTPVRHLSGRIQVASKPNR